MPKTNIDVAAPGKIEETKAEKFTRLATSRVNNILSQFESLAKLASANYEYTPEQIDKIITAIDNSGTIAFNALKNKGVKAKDKFTL